MSSSRVKMCVPKCQIRRFFKNKIFEFFMNFYQFEFSLKIPGGLRGTAGRRLGTFNKALDSFIFMKITVQGAVNRLTFFNL